MGLLENSPRDPTVEAAHHHPLCAPIRSALNRHTTSDPESRQLIARGRSQRLHPHSPDDPPESKTHWDQDHGPGADGGAGGRALGPLEEPHQDGGQGP